MLSFLNKAHNWINVGHRNTSIQFIAVAAVSGQNGEFWNFRQPSGCAVGQILHCPLSEKSWTCFWFSVYSMQSSCECSSRINLISFSTMTTESVNPAARRQILPMFLSLRDHKRTHSCTCCCDGLQWLRYCPVEVVEGSHNNNHNSLCNPDWFGSDAFCWNLSIWNLSICLCCT